METRNKKLPADSAPLKALDDFPSEMTQEIMHRAPVDVTFFAAQTSSYWRSYHYLQQLQRAVVANYHEEEQRILTNLLMNYPLLMKESAKPYLPQWVAFLKKQYAYTFEQEVFIPAREQAWYKNTVYAQALLIMLEADHSEERILQLDFLLTRVVDFIAFRVPIIMPELAYSLKWLIAQAQGKASKPTWLDIKGIIDSCNEMITIRTVCEAQLILAPYVGTLQQRGGELIGTVMSTVRNMHYLHPIFLLHALVKMIPDSSEFRMREPFVGLTVHLFPTPLKAKFEIASGVPAARIDLFMTFIKSSPMPRSQSYFNSLPWQVRIKEDFLADYRKAAAMCSLTDDESRVNWLRELFSAPGYDDALFDFAKRECAKLTTNAARQKAIEHLESKLDEVDSEKKRVPFLIDSLKAMISLQPTHVPPASPAATLKR